MSQKILNITAFLRIETEVVSLSAVMLALLYYHQIDIKFCKFVIYTYIYITIYKLRLHDASRKGLV